MPRLGDENGPQHGKMDAAGTGSAWDWATTVVWVLCGSILGLFLGVGGTPVV
jgi:hypothetical protein